MVRVLFIRHGMTKSNLRAIRAVIQVAKGNVRMEDVMEYEEELMKDEDESEWSGDTMLSDIGEMEAESLGLYWEEVLRKKLEASADMWFFVSPMQRCLQTIDPLMKRLGGLSNGTVHFNIFESPGLCHKKDQEFVKGTIQPLLEKGEVDRARKLQSSHEFRPCGLSQAEILKQFPWVKAFAGFPGDGQPWYTGSNGLQGYQSKEATDARVHKFVQFLYKLSEELPETDTCVFVSHGDFLALAIGQLMGTSKLRFSLLNTSVSSLKIARNAVTVEYLNRVDHLDFARRMKLYESMGLRQGAKRRVDIGKLMSGYKFHDTLYGKFLSKL